MDIHMKIIETTIMLEKKRIKFKKLSNQLKTLFLKVKYYPLLNFWLKSIFGYHLPNVGGTCWQRRRHPPDAGGGTYQVWNQRRPPSRPHHRSGIWWGCRIFVTRDRRAATTGRPPTWVRDRLSSAAIVLPQEDLISPSNYAATRASAHWLHKALNAPTRCSISASVCTGPGVKRKRSVPFGTVG